MAATLRACDKTRATLRGDDIEILAPRTLALSSVFTPSSLALSPEDPVATYKTMAGLNEVHLHYVPVVVCRAPVQTVGLGDQISSKGIAYAL